MATPTLKRSWAFVGCSSNNAGVGNSFVINLEASGTPCAMASGDLVILAVRYPHARTSITVTDNKAGGSNTYTSQVSGSDSGLNNKFAIFTSLVTGFASQITVAFNTNGADVQIYCSLWYNVASSSIVDGTSITTDITPANNTNPNVSAGSMTTTVDGDLIFYIAFDQASPLGVSNTINSTAWGASFSGLFAETNYLGSAAQYIIQGTHGAINPGMLFSQTTHDTFAALAIAIKPGTSGVAPGAGMYILKTQQFYNNVQANVNLTTAFPTSGNLFVAVNEAGSVGISLSSVSDSKSNTWTEEAGHPATFPQVFYAANPTNDNALTVTLHFGAGTGTDLVCLYDIVGAATSPLDTGATVPGGADTSALTVASSGASKNSGTQGAANAAIDEAPSLIPTTATGLIIAACQMGNGPITGANQTFDYMSATWSASGDAQSFSNGDGMCHVFPTSTGNQDIHWTCSGQSAASSWAGLAISFKAAPAAITIAVESPEEQLAVQPTSPQFLPSSAYWEAHDTNSSRVPTPPVSEQCEELETSRNFDWRYGQHEEDYSARVPTPPVSEQFEEGETSRSFDWRVVVDDGTEADKAPPSPVFAQEELEQPNRALDSWMRMDDSTESSRAPNAPVSMQEDYDHSHWCDWRVVVDDGAESQKQIIVAAITPIASDEVFEARSWDWRGILDDGIESSAAPPAPVSQEADSEQARSFDRGFGYQEEDYSQKTPLVIVVPTPAVDDSDSIFAALQVTPLLTDQEWSSTAPVPPAASQDDDLLRSMPALQATWPEDESSNKTPPPPPIILTAADDDFTFFDWTLGYGRFSASVDEYDSHLLPPTLTGPFVLIAALRHATYSALVASGGHTTYSQLQASVGMKFLDGGA